MDPLDGARKTPLHELHLEAGARMVEFGGWSMPVSFRGLIDEHVAVRERVGLFDVSHMGEAFIDGPDALALIQKVTCNDAAKLRPGRVQYTALTTPRGTFVDDLLVYALDEGRYMLVLNAANTAKDLAWLREHAAGLDVRVDDRSDEWALLSVQGPESVATLAPLTGAPVGELRYYRALEAEVCGAPCIVSRTGYTGELGFEIYAPAAEAQRLWKEILRSGAEREILPVGLGARDTLRLEAKMALYGQDIGDDTTVLEADLGWIVKLEKGDFVGRDALARQREEGIARKLVGFEVEGRAIARQGYDVLVEGRRCSAVTSGTHSPTLKKNIGLAYLPIESTEVGSRIEVEIRGRSHAATVVPTPFYKRPRG